MATLGHIGKFDPVEESISVYLECMDLFFAANGIKDEKHVAVLLSVIGPKIYALLCDLLAPESHKTNQWWLCLKLSRNTSSENLL